MRGNVYVVAFTPPGRAEPIEKLVVCLQQGKVVNNADTFVGVLTTTEGLDRRYPWEVFVSAQESQSSAGIRVCCGQVFTFPKSTVKRYAYRLTEETMREVDKALLRSLGLAME